MKLKFKTGFSLFKQFDYNPRTSINFIRQTGKFMDTNKVYFKYNHSLHPALYDEIIKHCFPNTKITVV